MKDEGKITYAQLHSEVCKFANVLKSKGIGKVRSGHRNGLKLSVSLVGSVAHFTG